MDGSVDELAKYYGTQRPPLIELPLNRIAKPESAAALEELLTQWKAKVPVDVWPNWFLSADRSKENSALAMALALLPGTFIYEPGAELQSPNASGDYFLQFFVTGIFLMWKCLCRRFCCDAEGEIRQGSAFY